MSKKNRDDKLPRYLVARTDGSYAFFNKPAKMDEYDFLYKLIGCFLVEKCPTTAYFKKYKVYVNENGMMDRKPMNLMLNTFTHTGWLRTMASIGGPFGDAVIVAPRCQKHSAKKLREGFKACKDVTIDKGDLDEYLDRLEAAITSATSSSDGVKKVSSKK
ncbi:MAG: hypothetical protein ACTSUE_09835 [Promethearchaeota archaeon]